MRSREAEQENRKQEENSLTHIFINQKQNIMKRFLRFLALVALMCVPWVTQAQTTVEIGDGTATSNLVPIGTYYNYSITEMLYTADEIGMAGTISSISFYYMGNAEKNLPIKVYMQNVDAADLSTGISLADAEQVFSGTLSVTTTAGWVTIDLDSPFAYDGTSNLLIGCIKDYLYYFSGQTWQGTSVSNMARYSQNDDNAYDVSTVPGSASSVRPNIQIAITPSGPICEKPSQIGVYDKTPNTAVVQWDSDVENYILEYKSASESEWTVISGLTSNIYTLESLLPLTSYSVRVKAVCGTDLESGYKSTTFTTPAGIPLIEAFATTSVPTQWTRYTGLLSDVQGGAALSTTTYGWNFNTGNGVFDNHARVNIYGTGCKYWLVTPSLTMQDNVQLTFDLALTKYSGELQPIDATLGADDKFVVLITTDGGTTWEILRQWDNEGSEDVYNDIACTAAGQAVAIDLSSYAGQSIAIAFYGESTVSETGSDNYLHIDNVRIDYIPSCAIPTGLSRSDVTAHSVTLSWNSEGADSWQLSVNDATEMTGGVLNSSESTFTLMGLTPETQYRVKVRSVCGGYYSEWTNNVTFTTAIACPVPTGVTVTDITTTTAVVNCTSNATLFNLMLGEQEIENVTLPYTLTNLEPSTTYTVKVKAVCGGEDGESEWSSSTTFMTADVCPDGMVCIGTGTSTSYYVPVNNYYNYSLTEQIYTAEEIGMAGAILSIDFYKAATTATEKDLDIYIVATDKDEFESTTDWITVTAADRVYSGTVTFVDNDWTTIELDNPFIYDGESNIAIVVDNNTGDYEDNTGFRVFTDTKNRALYYQSDNTNADPQNPTVTAYSRTTQKNRIRLAIGEPPACAKPAGLAVNYEGGTEATISWSSDAEEWNMRVNGEDVNATITNPYTLTGLDLATTYSVEVQAVCGNTESEWTSAVSFTTDLCDVEDQCEITFVLTDSYGDSWNGAAIQVTDVETGNVLGELANENLNGTSGSGENEENIKPLAVCNGRQIQFTWKSGNYDSEASYTVTDINDEEIFSGSGAMTEPVSYEVSCMVTNCKTPSDLAVSEIGSNSAQLSWTENGEAEAWVVAYKTGDEDFEEVDADANPYVLEGLTPETEYIVKVRPVCDDEAIKWSDVETFTTDVACPAPTELTATELTAESALLGWTGTGDNYNVRYRHASGIEQDFENGLNGWTSIDADGDGYGWVLGSEAGGIYLAEGGSLYGSDHSGEGDLATSGSYSNYLNSALTPDNYLVSPLVNLGGSISFWAVAQDANYPEEHFGVAVSTTGNTDASDFTTIQEWTMSATGATPGAKDQGTWVEITVDLSAYAGQTGYVAIRHFNCTDMFFLNIDDITISEPSNEEWSVAEAADNEILVEGLDPENKYEFQVQSVCGDVTSQWASATFTTLPNCLMPTELAVSDVTAHTAAISFVSEDAAWQYRLNGDDGNIVDIDENPFTIDGLTSETAYTVEVRTVCGDEDFSTWTAAVNFTTPVSCLPIEDLQVNDITTTSAELTWTSDAENFEVRLGEGAEQVLSYNGDIYATAIGGVGQFQWGVMFPAGTNSAAPLTKVSAYDYMAMTGTLYIYNGGDDAPGEEIASMPVEFTGAGAWVDFTFEEPVDIDVTENLWVVFDNESGASHPASTCVDEEDDANARWVAISGTWMDLADAGVPGYGFMIKANVGEEVEYGEPVACTEAAYTLNDLTPSTTYSAQVRANCGDEDGVSVWSTVIFTTEATCPAPTGLAVNYQGGNSAEVTFSSDADMWNIDINGEVIEGIESPYEMTDLEYGTTYTIKVQTDCGEETSEWTNAVSFTTDLCDVEDQCEITFVLTDAWGDGWNGAAIQVTDVETGNVLGELANENLNGTSGSDENEENIKTLAVCDGRQIQFTWISGSYDSEASYAVTDALEQEIFSGSGAMSEPVDYVNHCTPPECVMPTDLAVSDVTAHTATINFTFEADGAEYRLNGDDGTIAGIQELPLTIEGLDGATDYSIQVRAICGTNNTSDWTTAVSFTTLESCPAVTDVEVELVSTTSVNVTWNDENGAASYYIMMGDEMLGEETEPAVIINEQTATITGLTAETNYAAGAFQVFANCGELDGVSAGADVPAFFTGYCVPNPTSRDGKGITSVVFGSGDEVVNNVDETNGLPAEAPFYGNYSDMIGAMPAGLESTIAITYATGTGTVYSYGTIIWVDWNNNLTFEDDEIVYTGTSAQGSGGTPQVLEASFVVPATQELGDYRMRIAGADSYFDNYINGNATGNHSACFTSSYSVCHDYTLRVTEAPSCLPAADVTVSNIGTTTADLTWVNNNGADATYTVKNGDEVLTTEAVDGYQLTGLTPAHNYAAGTFTVIANCDETAVVNVPAFTTECDVIASMPWTENFEGFGANTVAQCWDNSASTTSSLNSNPHYVWGVYSNGGNQMIRMNNYYVQNGTALINTPAITIPAEGTYELTFEYAHNASCGDFNVNVSTDGGETFETIGTYSKGSGSSYTEPGEFTETTISLSDYAGQTVILQFFANANYGNGAIFVDNIKIDVPPTCVKPTDFVATLVPGDGSQAILEWTENGDATAWQICLNGDEDNLIDVTENPYTLENLTAEEVYTAKVRANCGDNGTSDWSNEVTFTPTNALLITVNEGTATNDKVPVYGNWCDNYSRSQFIIPASDLAEMQWGNVNKMTFYSSDASKQWGAAQFTVYVTETTETTISALADWDAMESVYEGSLSISDNVMEITFADAYQYKGGNLMIGVNQTVSGTYSSCNWYGVAADGASMGGYGTSISQQNFLPKMTFAYLPGEAPTCYKPTAVDATEITAESAIITWTRDERNAEGETYSILDENHEPVAEAEELTGDNFQLTGLEAAHEYTYYVLTNCANDEEVDMVAVTFTTLADCPAPTEVAVVENSVNAYNATISWTGYPANENGYLVSYRTAAYFDGVSEQFAGSSAPTGWTMYTGLLSNVMSGTALTTNSYAWSFGTNNNVFDSHARCNIYGNYQRWLVSPAIDVAEGFVLNFDLALTVYTSSSSASPDAGGQPDDKFVVLVSDDEMATWTILRQWDNEGSEYVYDEIPNTGENVSIDLSDFVGQTVNIAFYGESTTTNGDNNMHIDNVAVGFDVAAGDWETVNTDAEETTVELTNLEPETLYEVKVQGLCAGDAVSDESEVITFTTTPSCVPVTDVQVNNVTSNSVDVSWTAGLITDNAWQIAYRENGTSDWTEAAVYDNPFPLTDLTANTAYELRVRTFCSADEQSDWSNTVSFTTECDAFAIPYATGFESSDPTLSCWSMVDVASSTGFASDCFKFAYNTNPPQYLISPALTGTENGVQVEFDYKAGGSYAESFMVGYSTTTSEPDAFTWGEELTGITSTTYQRYYEIIPEAGVKYICIKYTANDMLALYIDNFEVKEIEEFNVNVAVSTGSDGPLGTVTSEPTDLTGLHYNDEVTLTAATDVAGYEFKGWYNNDDEGAFITDENPYTFNVTSDRYILAAFGLMQYTVSVSADDNGTAYIIDPETSEPVTSVTADYNSELTLVAEANTCYEFVNWTLNGDPVSTDASFTINVLDNNAYVANFTEKSYTGEETVTACDNYEWNGTVYEESTIVDVTLPSVEGCDSVATLYLTINNSTTGIDVQTACDSYEWIDGVTYTESNNEAQFTLEGGNAHSCDSLVTLNLTVNYSSTGIDEQVACDSYEWMDGETYTESTNEAQFTLEGANAYGCDSLVTLHLTVNNSTTGIDEQTACDSYTWIDGIEYTASNNEATFTLENANVYGCDSVVTLNLTINNSTTGIDVQTACDSYEWIDGETYTENNTTAQYIMENAAGCDSVITLNFTVRRSTSYTDMHIACDEFVWNDVTYTQSNNTATFTTINAAGCDSVVTLNLTVNYSSEGVVEETACNSFVWHGTNYTESTEDTYESVNAAGCDSVTTLYLTINHCATTTVTACDSYIWSITGDTYTESDTYIEGNDTLILTINHSNTGIETVTACDRYDWFEHTNLTVSSNDLTHEFTNVEGCDSIVTLNLTVNYSNTGIDEQVACDSYEWIDGETYTANNTVAQYTLENAAGCDSVVTLNLTINYSNTGVDEQIACDSYEWIDGVTYTESNNEATFTLENAAGCDSVVTLNLTVNYSTTGIDEQIACDSYEWIDGNTYTESNNTATFTMENAAGCDSVVTLNLTVNYSTTGIDEQTACDSYTWIDGIEYTASNNEATFTLENAAGCDSVVTLNLTVNYSNTGIDEQTACESFTWIDGIEYTESNNEAQFTLTNAAGCDSVVTLNLTVNYSNSENVVVTINENELPYTFMNTVFEAPVVNEPIEAGANVDGCDSTVYFTLIVHMNGQTNAYDTICDNELPYTWNNVEFTEAGMQSVTLEDIYGADSIVNMYLTVKFGTHTSETVVACNEYIWRGETYTESTTDVYEYTNADGCASDSTLNLTINTPVNVAYTETACEAYTWNDNEYIVSGDYTFAHNDENGCIQVDTLHLTINNAVNVAYTEAACEAYTWNNTEYTESGDYTFVHTDDNGCTQVDTLHLTINNAVNVAYIEAACEAYTWNNTEYTESGDYTFAHIDDNGCNQVDTLHLTINHSNTGVDVQTACESYTWIDGETYTESNNTATFALTNAAGCDSVVTLNLTVNYSNSEEVVMTITENQLPYTFMNIVFEAGVVNEPIAAGTNVNGCDSTVIFTLIVNMNGQTNDFRTICDNELPYTWNGVEFTEAGMQSVTLEDIYGADSVVNMYLTVNFGTHTTETVVACNEYIWRGETYTESDTYVYEYTNVDGCASDSTLNLTINTPVNESETVEACEAYTWNDNEYTVSGDYTFAHNDENGCIQVDTLHLTINNPVNVAYTEEACDVYTWNNTEYTVSGDYTFVHEDNNGCTQVDTLHLTINNSTESVVELTINENELPYTFNGEVFEGAETRDVVINNIAGCDSTIHFTLNVNWNSENTDEMTICASQLPYTWNGVVFETAGTKRAVLESVTGADSVVIMTLNVYPITNSEFSATACASYTWNDTPYAESGDYIQSFTDQYGCDSVVTLHLTINNVAINVVDEQIACDSYEWIDGNVYTESNNTATFTETSVDGCDSIITLNLTINYSTESELSATILQNQLPYTWNDQVFDGAESRDVVTTNLAGCDSTIHYTLNVIWNSENTDEMGICASQLPYTWNGVVFEAAGTRPVTLTSVITGADSVVIMTLNVYPEDNTEFSEAACMSYIWNNTTYTENGDYVQHFENQYGCDSTVTLHLTINTPVNVAYTEEACEVYTWNGTEYTESGDYTFAHEDVNGCNQVDTLHLTINNPVHLAYTEVACESYTWYNTEYTESGDYTFAHTDVHGCNQVDTLHLTINNPVHVAYTEEACEVYTWNNTNYTVSGDYIFAHTDDNGCNQVDTLHLTIYNAVPEVVTEVAYDTYTWNNTEYTESGDYTYSHIDANGCAQVDTLHLTINHYDSIVVILTVNDANMGTTDPVAGTYSFYPGDVVTATATANTGYEFVGWVVSNSMFGSDTVSREASVTYEMLPMMQGMTVNVEAVFREKVGIETADYSNINIFSTDNKIYVNGAEGMTIYIYDVNGRCMARRANAADSETFTVETTGVVLVKAGNAPAKRVVLVR